MAFVTRDPIALSARDYAYAQRALAIVPEDDWQDRAACIDMDPNLWFPEDEPLKEQRLWMEATAKAQCAICPVRMECLQYALRNREEFGTWGGYNSEEVHRLRRTLHVKAVEPAAVIPTKLPERIGFMRGRGWKIAEIAAELGISEQEVSALTPREEASA